MSHKMKPVYHEPSVPRTLMEGKGSARPSMFGVLGETKIDNYTKSLGGIVRDTKVHAYKDPAFNPKGMNTENNILGKSATHIAKEHYGQVLYQGKYMARLGPTA